MLTLVFICCNTWSVYLIVDIRTPTISQKLVYQIEFTLTGCIYEFCSIQLCTNAHQNTKKALRKAFYISVKHMNIRFFQTSVAHPRQIQRPAGCVFDVLLFAEPCDGLCSAQVRVLTAQIWRDSPHALLSLWSDRNSNISYPWKRGTIGF